MASKTLPNIKDATPRKSVLSGLCRCCNQSFPREKMYDLFGMKARSEKLVAKLTRFSDLKIDEKDSLPSKICHTCHSLVTRLDRMANAFYERCKSSKETQRKSSGRSKRQRNYESPRTVNPPDASSPLRKSTRTSERAPVRRKIIFMRPGHGNLPLQSGKYN